jgi:hypothetical protein
VAREVVIKVWCDVCKHLDPPIYNDGEEFTIAIGNAKPRVLALCEQDQKDLLTPLREVLPWGSTDVETKVKTDVKPSSEERRTTIGVRGGPPVQGICPACDRDIKSLPGHWRDAHQEAERMTLAQALGMETLYPCQQDGCPLAYANKYGQSQHMRAGNHLN